ncbi:MAG: methylenetetrahydrofolate reductase [candidate division Zixibacteria bacterium]|nr:methylenetetrahydrofolate reductase [candidate division Zixibacteria bacterium]
MRVIEHFDKAKETLFSYEIIPPKRGKSVRDILDVVEQLLPYSPPFIDVTSHSAEAAYDELDDGTIIRRMSKKRPGTISICSVIQNRYNIDTVPHLLCRGFTREETEDAMIELNFLGIENVMAIRGDELNYKKPKRADRTKNIYAADLVRQLNDLKQGKYLEDIANSEPIDMSVGVCGYPEKHSEAPNLKTDIMYLKEKVDAGADYISTQMFFENKSFFSFVEACRDAGITVPIIPGVKIIYSKHQLKSIPRNFHVDMPDELVDEIMASPKNAREIGLNWGVKQCRELADAGVPCIHFYILNDAGSVIEVLNKL